MFNRGLGKIISAIGNRKERESLGLDACNIDDVLVENYQDCLPEPVEGQTWSKMPILIYEH